MLHIGELEEARDASQELEQVAADCDSDLLRASAAQALGAVELAAGDATRALASLREAAQAWQELEAPYECARARVLVGRACRELGDDGPRARARVGQERLPAAGAAPDLAAASAGKEEAETHGLTSAARGAPPDRERLNARRSPRRS
jgi:hypothetical protein